MKVLLVGGGGREYALAWKIAQSPLLSTLYLVPGGPGFDAFGKRLQISPDDRDAIVTAALELKIDLVVVGPEAPLAAGLGDALAAAGVACFGPSKEAARLESSKAFMKEVCAAAGAPTAAYAEFTNAAAAKAYLRDQKAPYVIKADGLAAGKGVVIAETLKDADAAVDAMIGGAFGDAGARVIIEEFMDGEEASFFVICDGARILPLAAAQDHKRAHDGDTGPNTGGMGAYSPAPVFTDDIRRQTMTRIIEPVIAEMTARGAPYRGVLYAGLMIGEDGPRLVEFNVRFGDPECQILMRRLKSDLLPVLRDAAHGSLSGAGLDWRDDAAALIVMAADGYPGAYKKGAPIEGIEAAERIDDVVVFLAGAAMEDGRLVSNGGRVLNVTATGPTIADAVARAYDGVGAIDFPGGFYRRDIGWRAIGRDGAPGAAGAPAKKERAS